MVKKRWYRGRSKLSEGIRSVVILALSLMMIPVFCGELRATGMVYVQSVKAVLFAQPQLGAARIAEVAQGTALPVMTQQGAWYQVRYQMQELWVSHLLVADRAPGGKVSLLASNESDLSSGARRRASSFTTAAAARGLSADRRRLRGGYWTSDLSEVKTMEALKVTQSEVLEFLRGVEQ